MFETGRNEYSVKTCPTDDPEALEELLNEMSLDDWDLYTITEAESRSGGVVYNLIFCRQIDEEEFVENEEVVDVTNFKTRMEKILHPSDEPYDECREIQQEISQKQAEINKIKSQLDSDAGDIDRESLNEQMSKCLNDLSELKLELSEVIAPDRMFDRINQDKLSIIISDEIIDLVDTEKGGELISETIRLRQQLTDELGYVIPSIKFTNSDTLEANEYRIDVRGIKAVSGIVYPGYTRFYAGQGNINRKPKDGIEDIDPVTGERVFWIPDEKIVSYWEKGLNSAQVITEHLEYAVIKYADEIMDYGDINHYIEIVGTQNLYMIESLISEFLTIGELRYIMAQLIRERVSVKDLPFIFEKLNDMSDEEELEKDEILARLRIDLRKRICNKLADENGNIFGIVLSDNISRLFDKLTIANKTKLKKLTTEISDIVKDAGAEIHEIVVITPDDIRHKVFELLEPLNLELPVISTSELHQEYQLNIIETIDKIE